jgi:hypothetical protein
VRPDRSRRRLLPVLFARFALFALFALFSVILSR